MHTIGRVVRLQIQTNPLKTGEGDERTYHTTNLKPVSRLHLTPEGAYGLTAAGVSIMDVHHAQHPKTRYTGKNYLSFGFTHHYAEMRERFGEHLMDGAAGENMLLEADEASDLYVPTGLIGLQSAATGEVLILENVIVAVPCAPFTQFCLQSREGGRAMKEALQFLDNGRRGYYMRVPAGKEGFVQVGDTFVTID